MRRANKKKGIKAQRAKPPTPTRVIDEPIRNEEQNGKWKKEKENGGDETAVVIEPKRVCRNASAGGRSKLIVENRGSSMTAMTSQ